MANVLLGPILWVFCLFLGVTLDSPETSFAKTPFSWPLIVSKIIPTDFQVEIFLIFCQKRIYFIDIVGLFWTRTRANLRDLNLAKHTRGGKPEAGPPKVDISQLR